MRNVTFLFGAAVVLASSAPGFAHPNHGGDEHAHEHSDDGAEVSDKQKEKRLERVVREAERRQRNGEQRSKDRRRQLRLRLGRHLKGAPITPELLAELKLHAERTAQIRQIRYVAAVAKDYDAVVSADKLLARQNSQHEHWWRTVLREARAKP